MSEEKEKKELEKRNQELEADLARKEMVEILGNNEGEFRYQLLRRLNSIDQSIFNLCQIGLKLLGEDSEEAELPEDPSSQGESQDELVDEILDEDDDEEESSKKKRRN